MWIGVGLAGNGDASVLTGRLEEGAGRGEGSTH